MFWLVESIGVVGQVGSLRCSVNWMGSIETGSCVLESHGNDYINQEYAMVVDALDDAWKLLRDNSAFRDFKIIPAKWSIMMGSDTCLSRNRTFENEFILERFYSDPQRCLPTKLAYFRSIESACEAFLSGKFPLSHAETFQSFLSGIDSWTDLSNLISENENLPKPTAKYRQVDGVCYGFSDRSSLKISENTSFVLSRGALSDIVPGGYPDIVESKYTQRKKSQERDIDHAHLMGNKLSYSDDSA